MIQARTGLRTTRAGREDRLSHAGSLMSLLLTGEDTSGRLTLVEMVERKGAEPPCHRHTREDEIVYILDGLVSYYSDGEWLHCSAGTCVVLPRGCEHTVSIESEEARLLVILVRAGLEGYYREVGQQQMDGQAIERMVATAARYGMEITGPGLYRGRSMSGQPAEASTKGGRHW